MIGIGKEKRTADNRRILTYQKIYFHIVEMKPVICCLCEKSEL
jgi:hypothetical protein